jgi:uncharacterized OB-fold protein
VNDVTIHRCSNGHEFFYQYERCPLCDETLQATEVDGTAELVGNTTVRVNPSGEPFRLGIGRLPSGARTLCIVTDGPSVKAGSQVTLRLVEGVYHAIAEPAR